MSSLACQLRSAVGGNYTEMRQHNNLGMRHGFREHCYLTERPFLTLAEDFPEDKMTKRETIYMKFERFEEQLAHCYFLLHERFTANPPLARFWMDAALDELQHSSILKYCRDRGLMAYVNLDAKTAEHIEGLLDTVKGIATDPEVSIDEAFYASLLMESSELEDVYEKLTAALADDHPLLLEAIHAGLRSHHGAFEDAIEKFSGDRGFLEAFRNLRRRVS